MITTSISSLKPDAKEVMSQLAEIQTATDGEVNSTTEKASAARAGQQFMELNNSYLKNAVSTVATEQNKDNKVIDLNSLMTAFDDYVVKAGSDTSCGVPINFFIREITKADIAKAYLKKYSPLKNWQLSSDDDGSNT